MGRPIYKTSCGLSALSRVFYLPARTRELGDVRKSTILILRLLAPAIGRGIPSMERPAGLVSISPLKALEFESPSSSSSLSSSSSSSSSEDCRPSVEHEALFY